MHVNTRSLLLGLLASCLPGILGAADVLAPLDLSNVKLGGELGRRVDVTITNNLLVLDADRDFLAPFREKSKDTGYIGLGKLLDATVRLAAYSGDPRLAALKNHLIAETLQTQEADGYIGIIKPDSRVTGLWDVHETGYVVWGLMSDYEYFGTQESLRAAQRAADYILQNWSKIPADWGQQTGVATNVAVTGVGTMLRLYRLTNDKSYLDFVMQQRALPAWDLGIVVGRRPELKGTSTRSCRVAWPSWSCIGSNLKNDCCSRPNALSSSCCTTMAA